MFRVKRILSWNSSTDKLSETAAFYSTLFGAEEPDQPVTQQRAQGQSVQIRRMELGPLSLGLYWWSAGLRPEWDHHTYEVEWPGEAASVRAELELMGVEVEGVRLHGEGPGYSLTMRDPSGRRLEISTEPSV